MKRKIVFLIVMLGLVAGAYIGYKYLYKDHRNIENEVSVLEVEADELQLMLLRLMRRCIVVLIIESINLM